MAELGKRKRRVLISSRTNFDWLYIKRVFSFDEMSNLPKALRDKLKDQFEFVTLSEIAKYQSQDGTVKFLFELEDKNAIETVVMKHNYGNSICVTTQVGCRVGCTFVRLH